MIRRLLLAGSACAATLAFLAPLATSAEAAVPQQDSAAVAQANLPSHGRDWGHGSWGRPGGSWGHPGGYWGHRGGYWGHPRGYWGRPVSYLGTPVVLTGGDLYCDYYGTLCY
ncbi:hypothetical protein [Sphaerimonospora thailandensis]|uniref:Sulfur globule protein n=1 Tax=Sphaerimonospora thailandensis TaxID=795644 RepID=A0A8J3RGQ6_9ACTN|nr:hypothetical protein [Sphaerimonospora thailandensis]GIH73557.1 hypothetical protein Mth01_58100 [Sphaerimonospora thailandensis]